MRMASLWMVSVAHCIVSPVWCVVSPVWCVVRRTHTTAAIALATIAPTSAASPLLEEAVGLVTFRIVGFVAGLAVLALQWGVSILCLLSYVFVRSSAAEAGVDQMALPRATLVLWQPLVSLTW